MGVIPMDNLEEGMVLAKDVQDRNGRLLLGAGAELTAKHLHIFRTWGVVEAFITGVETEEAPPQLPPEISPEQLAAAEEELKPLFRHADLFHPALRELLRISALRKVGGRHG